MYKFIPIALLLSGCTIANADIEHGTLDIYTFATSRKDVKIARSADGAVSWETSDSAADASVLNNLSAVVAKLVGATVIPVMFGKNPFKLDLDDHVTSFIEKFLVYLGVSCMVISTVAEIIQAYQAWEMLK